MGKISDYANVLKSKLTDLFVVYQRNDGELETKNATLEQLGDAICGEQVHSDLKTDNQTIIGGINELAKDKNIADKYDDTQTYDKGDVVIYKNTLYICTTNNTTGAWDATKWTATTVQSLIGSLSSLTTTVTSSLVGAVNEVNEKESETLTYSSGGNTASFKFSRFGNMVCVGGSGGAMPLPTSWTNLTGTLSAKFRPTTALSLALITGDNHLIFLEINTNGTVRVYSNYSGNLYPSGTGIYVTT